MYLKFLSFFKSLQKALMSGVMALIIALSGIGSVWADDEEFVPAYQHEGGFEMEDANKYITYRNGRKYYTSGKSNGFRVNENNEESTDETIGILTLLIAPATIIYMNLIGWWE